MSPAEICDLVNDQVVESSNKRFQKRHSYMEDPSIYFKMCFYLSGP